MHSFISKIDFGSLQNFHCYLHSLKAIRQSFKLRPFANYTSLSAFFVISTIHETNALIGRHVHCAAPLTNRVLRIDYRLRSGDCRSPVLCYSLQGEGAARG
jgi:hypothetical protein